MVFLYGFVQVALSGFSYRVIYSGFALVYFYAGFFNVAFSYQLIDCRVGSRQRILAFGTMLL